MRREALKSEIIPLSVDKAEHIVYDFNGYFKWLQWDGIFYVDPQYEDEFKKTISLMNNQKG